MTQDSRIGTEIAGYRVESLLGRGGMSVVYLAEQSSPRRRVALKLLAPELSSDATFRDRFTRESDAAASIEHPNIIPIYQSGEADGVLYIAMRYVEGTDLKALIAREGPLAPERAAAIITQVASALDAAHRRSLIHRDVKPGNVLVASGQGPEASDHVYLSDFGLFKRRDELSGITKTGQFMGTVDYVSPEQIEGKSPDGRADVYSLGCVLYECLTGEPPFRLDNEAALLYAHLHDPPPKPSEARPGLPKAIDDVVAKAMAKRPEDRFQTAGELAGAARTALGATSDPAITVPPVRPSPRRVRILAAGAAAALVVAVAAVVLLTRGNSHPSTGPSGPTGSPAGSPTSSGPGPAAGPPSGSIVAVDPATRKVMKVAPNVPAGQTAGGHPIQGFGIAMAVGEGGVWFYADPIMSRIDLRTAKLGLAIPVGTTVGVGEGAAVAVDFRAVWVLGSSGVTVVDPATSGVIDRIRLSTGTSPVLEPTALTTAAGAVWVTIGTGKMVRIDPNTQHKRQFTIGGNPTSMVTGAGRLWIVDKGAGTLTQFDLRRNRVIKTSTLNGSLDQMAFGGGKLWILDESAGQVTPISGSGSPGNPVRVGSDPTGIAAGLGAVWVSDRDGSIYRVGFDSQIPSSIRVGSSLAAIAVDSRGGRLWVFVD